MGVSFRLDKFTDPIVLRQRYIKAIILLLKQSNGDAVLLFNDDTVVLLRKNGQLLLNPIKGYWDEKNPLALLPNPYEFQEFDYI